MSNQSHGGLGERATPAMFTVFAVLLGVVLYVECGMDVLIPYVLLTPFSILLLWQTWRIPTLTERYAQPAEAKRVTPRQRTLKEAHS